MINGYKKKLYRLRLIFTITLIAFLVVVYFVSQQKVKTEYILFHNVDQTLDELAHCESSNRDVHIVDINGFYSRGIYQLQYPLVSDFYQKMLNEELTESEFVEIASDKKKARFITKSIIQEEFQGGWRNWYNCFTKINK